MSGILGEDDEVNSGQTSFCPAHELAYLLHVAHNICAQAQFMMLSVKKIKVNAFY